MVAELKPARGPPHGAVEARPVPIRRNPQDLFGDAAEAALRVHQGLRRKLRGNHSLFSQWDAVGHVDVWWTTERLRHWLTRAVHRPLISRCLCPLVFSRVYR